METAHRLAVYACQLADYLLPFQIEKWHVIGPFDDGSVDVELYLTDGTVIRYHVAKGEGTRQASRPVSPS